ncbi:MAG: hypothetical protein ABIR15_09080 [Chitinophagaceae bacterium]
MKSILLIAFLLAAAFSTKAQKVDSIYFHLYTDSLKKGTYNYINVDGKLSNGHWLPLTAKEINFSASAGNFDGNSLFIDNNFAEEKITVKAVLKVNPAIFKETIIYIKKLAETEGLKINEEVMRKTEGKDSNQYPGLMPSSDRNILIAV